jgi:DNA mismatch repair protein MutL
MPPSPRGPILSRSAPLDADGAEAERDASPERTIWQLHNRFLLSPVRSGLLIVDQQAAHERILYERALAAIEGGLAPSQQLLFPFPVDLPADDRALIDEIAPDLRALGFDLVVPSDGSPVLVRGVPADVTLGDEREALADLVAQFRRNQALLGLGARENLARSLARRSAVKPGQALGPLEARTIIDQLFGCAEPFSAPGGRPTMVRLSEEEIDQRFRR